MRPGRAAEGLRLGPGIRILVPASHRSSMALSFVLLLVSDILSEEGRVLGGGAGGLCRGHGLQGSLYNDHLRGACCVRLRLTERAFPLHLLDFVS